MDTTKKNIEMARKAEEIQEAWVPDEGDFCYIYHKDIDCDALHDGVFVLFEDSRNMDGLFFRYSNEEYYPSAYGIGDDYYGIETREKTWLPRQDQLQDMIEPDEEHIKEVGASIRFGKFFQWMLTTGGPNPFFSYDYKSQFTSMEQLWLAFVMSEKYGKVWDGKDWV